MESVVKTKPDTTIPPPLPFLCHPCFVGTWFSITEWWHYYLMGFLWWIPRTSLGKKCYFSFASPTPKVPSVHLKLFNLPFFWGEISQWLIGIYPSSDLSGLPKSEPVPHSVKSNNDLPQMLKPHLNLDLSPLRVPLGEKESGKPQAEGWAENRNPRAFQLQLFLLSWWTTWGRRGRRSSTGKRVAFRGLGKGSLGIFQEIWKCVESPAVTRKMQISVPDKQ